MMILDKIKFSYEEAENPKSKKFTPNHTIFSCKIGYNKKSYSFEYQCNAKYEMPTIERVMNCLMVDMESYDNSIDVADFANCFGYDNDLDEARRIYSACEKESKALHRIFTDTELTEINDDLFYCFE